MSMYLSSLISVSALVGICSFLSFFESEDKGLKIAASVILTYTLMLPAVSLVKEAVDLEFREQASEDLDFPFEDTEFSKVSERSFCEGVKNMIASDFSLSPSEVRVVAFDFDARQMKARKIKIILSGAAVTSDARGIEYAVASAGLGECEVELSGKR